MTGMMPAWLTLSGMYVEEPPNILRPTMRRAYCTGMRRCACSMKITAATMTQPDQQHDAEDPRALGLLDPPQRGREGGDDLAEDQDRHAVADAAVGDELAEPHDDGRAGGHGDDHRQEGRGAVAVQQVERAARSEQVARAGEGDDAGRLQEREAEREVAGVLGDLGLPRLALLLQRLESWDDHDEQLEDDARGDVGHDPQREDRQLEQRTAGEQVDELEEPAVLDVVDARLDVRDIDTRGRHLRAEPEDHDDQQDEQQLAPQVRRAESVGERAEHRILFRGRCRRSRGPASAMKPLGTTSVRARGSLTVWKHSAFPGERANPAAQFPLFDRAAFY